jgi:hypothetical protein
MAWLTTLARNPDRCTAQRVLAMLRRYLDDPRSIATTVALGADASRAQLAALAWVEARRTELTTSAAAGH